MIPKNLFSLVFCSSLAVSCFKVNVPQNLACGEHNECPGGYHCGGSICFADGVDASVPSDMNCSGTEHACSGACVNNDVNACGASCTKCATDPNGKTSCDRVACVTQCNEGYLPTPCKDGSNFVCTKADENNCGACGTKCPVPANGGKATCQVNAGVFQCVESCPTGTRLCASTDSCIGPNDPCSNTCPSGKHLCGPTMMQSCVDNSAITSCGTRDNLDCSSCVVMGGTATCKDSGGGYRCGVSCDASLKVCGNACISPDSCCVDADCPQPGGGGSASCDPSHVCHPSCPTAEQYCGGTCVSNNDVNNCGACAITCSTNNIAATCSGGACNGICSNGYEDCNNNKLSDGCETNITSDINHCGGCTVACSAPPHASPTCGTAGCDFGCDSGYTRVSSGCDPVFTTELATQTGFRSVYGYATNEVYVGGSGGVLYTNAGGSWQLLPVVKAVISGVGSGVVDIGSVWVAGSKSVRLVGSVFISLTTGPSVFDYVALSSSDGGNTWTLLKAQDSGVGWFSHYWGISGGEEYIAGTQQSGTTGVVLAKSRGWRPAFSTGTITNITALSGSGGNVYAVGNSNPGLATYNGTTWSAELIGTNSLSGVFSNGQTLLAVGPGTVFNRTSGQTDQLESINSAQLNAVWGASNDWYIPAVFGEITPILYYADSQSPKQSDWRKLALPGGVSGSLNSVWASSDGGDVFVVSDSGLVLHHTHATMR